MKVRSYTSKEFGHVILAEWDDGVVSIIRRAKAPERMPVFVTNLSSECADKIEELRRRLPDNEVVLAV